MLLPLRNPCSIPNLTPNNLKEVFVIIPVWNEEKYIRAVLEKLVLLPYRIVVVDDGSTDQTAKFVQNFPVDFIRHTINRGQGAALETGNQFARENCAKVVVHFDGDGQFNPSDIAAALEHLVKNDLHVVLGSRFLDDRSHLPFTKKYFILPIGRLINYFLTGLWLSDPQNGFRVFSSYSLATVRIFQDKMAHNSEIVSQIKKQNLRFEEIPVEVRYHRYGQGWRGGIKILWDWLVHWFI